MKYRVRVAAIIIMNNKILLVKHVHPESGFEWWVPPGGGLEPIDKSIHECAVREVWEETGYNSRTDEILYIREFVDVEDNAHNLEIFLKGKIVSGELTIKNVQGNGPDEHYIKEVRWIDQKEVKDLIVFPEIIKENEIWQDVGGKILTKYLGRQEG